MTCGRRARAQLLMVFALVATTLTATTLTGDADAANEAGPAPAVTASSLAAKVTSLTTKVTQLEARASELDRQVTIAADQVDKLSSRLDTNTRESSELVAAAQRQALSLYMNADPAQQTFALAAAITKDDVNDVAWSVGLLKINSRETMKLARTARKRTKSADAALTEALSTRDRLTDERNRLNPLIAQAKLDVKAAEADLEDFVHRLGPGTISGMTTVAYDAYRIAEKLLAIDKPNCGLRWELLAAIGKTESNHGLGRLAANGDTSPPILGIPIGPDTDQGVLDTDPKLDHAVGPMQFIPSTWVNWGSDGNNDGVMNINNVYDEARSAGRYLCAAAGDLTLLTRDGVIKAIWAYNPNEEYLRVVGGRFEALAADVARGWFSSADLPTPGHDPGTSRPVAPSTSPTQTPTAQTTFAPFTASGVASGASIADATPALCGPSASLAGRAGVYRCQLVLTPAANDAAAPAGQATGELLDPCVAAPFDGTLLACTPEPAQAVRLVRVAAPVASALGAAPPYFAVVLDGGDRCLPTGTLGGARVFDAPAPGTFATFTTIATGGLGRSVAPRSPAAAFVPRQAVTTTTTTAPPKATTTTGAPATTTTTAPVTTTTKPATTTTAPVTTTTTAPKATTTAAATTTTTTTIPATTTTTVAPPAGVLPPPANSATAGYRCASGAQIVGQPVIGVAQNLDPTAPTTAATVAPVVKATTTVGTAPAGAPATTTWVASVTQAGVNSRTVAVVELIS